MAAEAGKKQTSTFRVHVSIKQRYRDLIQLIDPLPKEYGVRSEFCTDLMLDGLKYRELLANGAISESDVSVPGVMSVTNDSEPNIVHRNQNDDDDVDDLLFG